MAVRPVDQALLAQGSEGDPRLGTRVVEGAWDVAIVGCADDTGVVNGGGRAGAAAGPTEIRRWLYEQTTGMNGELASLRLHDAGDVLPGATIEETHADLERVVAGLAASGRPVVMLGGGHDLAYASHSGLLAALPGRLALVNLDTHLDVRPLKDGWLVTSGTPFMRILDRWSDRVAAFSEVGIQPQHNAKAHLEWVRARRGRIVTLEDLRQAPGAVERVRREIDTTVAQGTFGAVSVDLDVAAASVAPGVSAPPADGLSAEELAAALERAGRNPKVMLVDVVEHAPAYDENGRTARLAALCLWRFLMGVAKR